MKILLDECVPLRLRQALTGHDVYSVYYAGLSGLSNGKLIIAAANNQFDVMITIDRGYAHQQNKMKLPIAIILIDIGSDEVDALMSVVPKILIALSDVKTGEFVTVR